VESLLASGADLMAARRELSELATDAEVGGRAGTLLAALAE
jgi:hypothetical protein